MSTSVNVNESLSPQDRTVGLAEGWTRAAMGLLIAVGLAFLLIGVNSLVGPVDPALQDVGQIIGP
jgi:hypothetical protein